MNDFNQNKGARESKLSDRYLSFELASENYAIPLLQVKEVIELKEITPVPNSPLYAKGIINLRGQIISIIDLRLKLSMKEKESDSKTAIIVLDLGTEFSIGVIVDKLKSVQAFSQESIDSSSTHGQNLLGVAKDGNSLTLLLDIERVLNLNFVYELKEAA